MAKKNEVFSMSDFRIDKIWAILAKNGRCEVICQNATERQEPSGFIIDNPEGAILPRNRESDTSRLFIVTGVAS